MKIRVYYEDTDAGGIVYHTNYIKYCERARSELFFAQNLKPFIGDASGFIVRSLHADFIAPASLGDMLEVKTFPLEVKRISLQLRQEIYRKETKLFEMTITLVYLSDSKPSRIPKSFFNLF